MRGNLNNLLRVIAVPRKTAPERSDAMAAAKRELQELPTYGGNFGFVAVVFVRSIQFSATIASKF